METELWMDDITAARRAVDGLLAGSIGALLDLLAEEVELEVAGGGDVPGRRNDSGKQAVVEYFAALGGVVAFWRMDYTARGQQLIAWGHESFTVKHCELEGGCEFALVFDLAGGRITRLRVIEDLASFAGPLGLRHSGFAIQSGRNSSSARGCREGCIASVGSESAPLA